MTTTIPQPCEIDFARPLGGLDHFFSLIDQHRAVHFAMAAQMTSVRAPSRGPGENQMALGRLMVRQEIGKVLPEWRHYERNSEYGRE